MQPRIGSRSNSSNTETAATKKPSKTLGFTGFSQVGLAGFEPTTSTTPRKEHCDFAPAKTRVKRESYEVLHQMLHQIAKLVERDRLDALAAVLVDSLEPDAFERLADAISRRVAKG